MSTVTFHLFSVTYFKKKRKEKDEYMYIWGNILGWQLLQRLSCYFEGPALSAGHVTDTTPVSCVTTSAKEPRPGFCPPAVRGCSAARTLTVSWFGRWLVWTPAFIVLPLSSQLPDFTDLALVCLGVRSNLGRSLGFPQLLLFHS